MIKIITSTEKAANAAVSWRNQYFQGGKWIKCHQESSEDVYKNILAAKGDPQAIADVIGNKDWSFVACGSCGENFNVVIDIGKEWEPFFVCQNCLTIASAALTAVSKLFSK